MKKIAFILLALCAALLAAGCAAKGTVPTVKLTGSAEYRNAEGTDVRADYYTLGDDTLPFVKLYFGDGEKLTLPLAVSASGARYTDDFQYVWWIKGSSAWLEKRGEDGSWVSAGSEFTTVN